MTPLLLDNIGLGLLRELAEAWGDYYVTWQECQNDRYGFMIPISQMGEYHQRFMIYHDAAEQFVEHMIIMQPSEKHIADYAEARRQELLIHEDDRDMGRVDDLLIEACDYWMEALNAYTDR